MKRLIGIITTLILGLMISVVLVGGGWAENAIDTSVLTNDFYPIYQNQNDMWWQLPAANTLAFSDAGDWVFEYNPQEIAFKVDVDGKLDIEIYGYKGMTEAAEAFINYLKQYDICSQCPPKDCLETEDCK